MVVVIASDAHNTKPYARPAAVRARAVRALGIADRVVIGGAKGFLPSVLKVRPNIIALGYDQTLPVDVAEKVEELGIRVRRIPKCKNISTSKMLKNVHRK